LLAFIGWRATRSARIGSAAYLISLQIGQPNNPGRAFAVLARGKSALGDETADGGCAEGKSCRRFVQCYLATVGALSVAVDGDVIPG
jgi:hypothetical protein